MLKKATHKTEQIQTRLLEWHRLNQRYFPWSGESSTYRVWVSEVMLQQTQVATVIPYYHRFLEKFPSVDDLAAAPLEDVLKAWEGLGYYARARNMHKAANEIVEKWGSEFPTAYADLRTLPGFGDYIAGAIASVVYGEVVPAVDGNVKRALSRLFAIEDDITRGPGTRQLKEIAAELVAPDAPGDWTQAIMGLGATVCVPRSPKCSLCPVTDLCEGRARGIERSLPVKPAKKALPHFDVTAAVIHQNGKVLIAQRPLDGMLGGMWEFPGGKQEEGETLSECLKREIREELGVDIEVGESVTSIQHSYTHFKITLHAFSCRLLEGVPQLLGVADWRWVTLKEINAFPFPRTDQKIIAVLKNRAK